MLVSAVVWKAWWLGVCGGVCGDGEGPSSLPHATLHRYTHLPPRAPPCSALALLPHVPRAPLPLPPGVQGDNCALHWASMRGHVEIVKFLLQAGADKGLRNKQDKAPVDLCQPCWSNAYRFAREVLAEY